MVRSGVSTGEEQIFRIVNNMPQGLWLIMWPVMQLGNLAAPIVIAGAAAFALWRWRPPTAVLIAGYGAWAAAQLVKNAVIRDRPDALLSDVVLREGVQGLGFVSGHAAIATAMATAAWPYLSVRGRAIVAVLVVVVGLGRIYAGAHLPLDVVGGAAIGTVVGLATNAAVGLPRQRLSISLGDERG